MDYVDVHSIILGYAHFFIIDQICCFILQADSAICVIRRFHQKSFIMMTLALIYLVESRDYIFGGVLIACLLTYLHK